MRERTKSDFASETRPSVRFQILTFFATPNLTQLTFANDCGVYNMASLSDDTLRKVTIPLYSIEYFCLTNLFLSQILQQIQQTAVNSQRALNITRQQTLNKERERRVLQLTIEEITSIEGDVNLYRGVGKMCARPFHCVRFFVNNLICRFMMVPRATMEKDLKDQEKGFTDDITSLNKKVCSLR